MSMSDGFEVYKIYLGVKLHFDKAKKYDVTVAKSHTKTTQDAFDKRGDKWKFVGLAKKIKPQHALGYFVSNAVEIKNLPWIGDMLEDANMDTFQKWRGRMNNVPHLFEKDVNTMIRKHGSDPRHWLSIEDDDNYPVMARAVMDLEISPEAFCMLCSIFDCWVKFGSMVDEGIYWPEWHFVMHKYDRFIRFNRQAYAKSLRSQLKM